jgi:MFS family permease
MFGSLRVRNFRLYFVGQGISVAGNWMQNIAISWLALQLSHSGTILGIVMAARYLPILLLGSWGGLIADRIDNRRLLTITQTCLAVVSALFAVLASIGLMSLPSLVVLVLLLGLVNVFDGPSRQSLISQLVARRYLTNAIGLTSVMMNTAKMVGPGIAGAMIAAVGVTPCFVANAASFGAVIVSLLLMRPTELHSPEREVRAKGQIRAAMTYTRQTPVIFYPLLMVIVTGVLTWEFPVSLPLVTTDTFHSGAGAFGAAMACMSAGAVCGGVVAARRRTVSVRSLSVSAVLWGTMILAASLAPVLPIEFALLVFVGAASITFNSSAKTLLQLEAAPTMRGRIMSLWSIAWQGGTVIGAPIVGYTGAALGGRYALMLGGIAALAIGLVVLVLPAASRSNHRQMVSPGQRQLL